MVEIKIDNSHQSNTVATDAQVPGPAGRRPIPKKVPTSQAHGVRRVDDLGLVALMVIMIRFRLRTLLYFFEKLGIEPVCGPPDILVERVKSEIQKWAGVVREKNIRLEQ